MEKAASAKPNPDLAGAPTTIRLSPEARAFFAAQAEAFGQISTSSFIAMTLEGVMRATQSNDPERPQEQLRRRIELSRDRLLYVFQAHGIEPHEIASLLKDFGVTTATLHEESALLSKLTDQMIAHVAEHFHIERSWLSGSQDYRASTASQEWYKNTHGAIRTLIQLSKDGLRPEVIVIRRYQADFARSYQEGDSAPHEDVGVLIQTEQKTPNGRPYKVYELWDFERWNYPKCRHYLKALIMWLSRQAKYPSHFDRIKLCGRSIDNDLLQKLICGRLLPVEALQLSHKSGSHWDPQDYVDPESSLETEEVSIVEKHYYDAPQLEKLFEELIPVN
ncbi:hypothetical protein J7373_14535 [Xanthomonas sp. A2111]|uniref:Uncharacterized protein n=1 Tax=Xanthomonas hawaiiensis TaxID=3003247 RepID=A0ABU2I6J3_9XANT|nr:hypothetical protein [Xanthomonas sp. A2111]MBO9829466.1 hypothetical protein [Xanthomonas sp. A2111]MDS9993771.1 hypothetical protein [Xanthomonas sp. A2111]